MNALPKVMAPVLTPFLEDLSPDFDLFVGFCRWLESQGAGLAVFGTNSEANSLTVEERLELLSHAIEGGIDPSRLVPGTGACAIGDAVRLTRAAVQAKCAGVLMLPPFYYKQVSEDGLFGSFAEVIERVGEQGLQILLYHIPQVSGVAISPGLIERLRKRYPRIVVGMKDSSGDMNYTKAAILRFPGFKVYAGSDALLLGTLRLGGEGCISATANVNPAAIVKLREDWQKDDAERRQEAMARLRKIFEGLPMISALKAAVAHHGKCARFAQVRPPLMKLNEAQAGELTARLAQEGFAMPGLEAELAPA
jgi:4-hydroxy-tetrahydrodipicolinate synthase